MISIHAPHEGERHCPLAAVGYGVQFQSTLPTRGSDRWGRQHHRSGAYFNPRSPRGGATKSCRKVAGGWCISIHAPHEGERLSLPSCATTTLPFQSTLPTRGSDGGSKRMAYRFAHFNPRSPRGGATTTSLCSTSFMRFQSTLPTRGSDIAVIKALAADKVISIHAPHEGERPAPTLKNGCGAKFQSTLPTRGSDLCTQSAFWSARNISIHAPHEGERPADMRRGTVTVNISIHAPHEGERLAAQARHPLPCRFQSTLPTRGSDLVTC